MSDFRPPTANFSDPSSMSEPPRQFEPNRLLPISNGRFAMWLFISTEIMFFAGLFSSYLVLRAAVPGGEWPQRDWVHVSLTLGAVNTLILVLSSITAGLAVWASRRGRPGPTRTWLLVTLLLGTSFLTIKAFEYRDKFELGISVNPQGRQIFDQPDIYYLAAVRHHVEQQIERLERQLASGSPSATPSATPSARPQRERIEQQSEKYQRLRTGLVAWTERQLIEQDRPEQQIASLNLFARLIYDYDPRRTPSPDEQLAQERLEVDRHREELQADYEALNDEINGLNASIIDLESRLRELGQVVEPDEEVEQQREELTGELNQLGQRSNARTQLASQMRQQLVPLEDRLKFLDEGVVPGGVNFDPDFALPIVIPAGGTWANLYYLLTGMHALHLLAGVLVLAVFLLPRLVSRSESLHVAVLYWHFVDVVWLVMFAVLYLELL